MAIDTMEDFAHIRRMQDDRCPHEVAVILPGEYFVSREEMIVYTVLGSCISVCIRDPVAGVGGMNHFMLPEPKGDGRSDSWGESARYGSYAMEMLINNIMKGGGVKSRFEVKVFGGGRIYDGAFDVGANNATWAFEFLKAEGLKPISKDVGGIWPRKVYYFVQSGRVLLKRIEKLKNDTLLEREQQYRRRLKEVKPTEGDVTLF